MHKIEQEKPYVEDPWQSKWAFDGVSNLRHPKQQYEGWRRFSVQ